MTIFFDTKKGHFLKLKAGERSGLELFTKRNLERSLIIRVLLGQKRVQTLWMALEETAKPIKNVLVPFLIILEEK